MIFLLLLLCQCKEQCESIDCGPYGTCISGECNCDEGWTGDNCNITNSELAKCSRHQDSLSLVELYNATNGQDWTYNGNLYRGIPFEDDIPVKNYNSEWDFTQPITTWHGIEVNTFGCLSRIMLFDCNLIGDLPELNFPTVEYFVCSQNLLTGTMPDLSNLPRIEVFDCTLNKLTGNIRNPSGLQNLRHFQCGGNNLTGTIPDFRDLPKLERFGCNVNDLTGIMLTLSGLPSLTSFSCTRNSLSGAIPKLENLPSLVSFYCSDNQMTGNIPCLSELPSLIHFSTHGNQLSGPIPNLIDLPNLKSFYCYDNQLSGCMPLNERICSNKAYNFKDNPGLAWEGDYERVCNNENQIGAPCITSNGSAGNISMDCNCE